MQVTIKSPTPDRPEKVRASPPSSWPRRAISAMPRVMSMAFVLSPKPYPSLMPTATAMMFFMAPPSSALTISGEV